MDQHLDVQVKVFRFAVVAALAAGVFVGCASSRQGFDGRTTLNVLTININSSDSARGRADAGRIADLIKELSPDVVAIQGIRRDIVQSDAFDVLTTLSDLTGMAYAFGETGADGKQRTGNGFLTRHPILEEQNTLYPSTASGTASGLLRLLLDVGGSEITVLTTGLDGRAGEADLEKRTAALNTLVRENATGPTVFLGSLGVAEGEEIGPLMKETLSDAWEQVGKGPGSTFPSDDLAYRNNFVFFTRGRPGFRALSARFVNVPSMTHLPLSAELELVDN